MPVGAGTSVPPVNNGQQPQTFSLGNGKTYDVSGNEVDQNGNIGTGAGLAGLSATDFLSLLGSSTATNTSRLNQIQTNLGIPAASTAAFAQPAKSTVDFYTQAYNAAGLADLKQKIADYNDQIAQTHQQYIDAVGRENENPFLSEAARVGRVQNLYNTAQETIANLTNEQANYQNLYAQGVNEVNNAVTRYTNDFTYNQNLNQQKLSYLLSQAEAQETAGQNTDIQGLIERYFPEYASTYAQTKAAETPFGTPQTGLYTYNPTTKSYTQVSPPVGQFSPITTPLGGVLGFNTNTGQVNNTGANTYSGQPGSVGGFNSNPTLPVGGSFPQGSQTQGSAAAFNNPGGLKDPTTGQFQQFSTPDQGFAALVQDVQGKISGNTRTGTNGNSSLLQLAQAWKGTGNNNAQAWAQSVAQNYGGGIGLNTPIGQLNPVQLASAIAKHETGFMPGQMPNNNVGGPAQPTAADQTALIVQPLMQAFQNLSPSFSNPQQLALSASTFQGYLQSGNLDAATSFITKLAYQNMQPAVQSKVDNTQQAIDAYTQALSIMAKHPER